MDTRNQIYRWIKLNKSSKNGTAARQVVIEFRISRQTVTHHLREFVKHGLLVRSGSTRSALYYLPTNRPQKSQLSLEMVERLKDLQEDRIFEEISHRLPIKSVLVKNVFSIFYYAFTEMLNNAIDHSKATICKIDIRIENGDLYFSIRDQGIGAFANVMKTFRINDEFESASHLFKGKQTTFPDRHSGQGIFFTSRIADRFILSSHRIDSVIDNQKEDFLIKERQNLKGTQVQFWIKTKSKKSLEKLFKEFANEDFEFVRNQVRLRLVGEELISRSQARRLLFGLDRFEVVKLDFKKVKGIGQVFADEIFRVFQKYNPKIKIQFENANTAIQFIIARVEVEKNN